MKKKVKTPATDYTKTKQNQDCELILRHLTLKARSTVKAPGIACFSTGWQVSGL